ncbi:MAG: hypothetical protein A3D94_18330 [Alphaproteobacteria bacterium RIFCSPHIGHO2_12_FULL_66_14]|nr:MAG: hypothetical protein A3D94_18330 [Alphaproteobacteria bacterium RIFCSPHIGHO2_12_FULL_66_14]
MRRLRVIFLTALLIAGSPAIAQQLASTQLLQSCPPEEPDSIQISWTAPCDGDGWLFDTEAGCRLWDWHPAPDDKAVWSGACRDGLKHGTGVVQWTEHGQAIDRFEGTYRFGRREGFGRYTWNATHHFEGNYADNVPDGYGTIRLGSETLEGPWRNGCLAAAGRVVAIGVPRVSCMAGEDRPLRSAGQ